MDGSRNQSMTGDVQPVQLPRLSIDAFNTCCPCNVHQNVFHHLPYWASYDNMLSPASNAVAMDHFCLHRPECEMATESIAMDADIVVNDDFRSADFALCCRRQGLSVDPFPTLQPGQQSNVVQHRKLSPRPSQSMYIFRNT